MHNASLPSHALTGGMLGLELGTSTRTAEPPFFKSGELLFVNARSALAWLVEALCPNRVWLPSYLCACLVETLYDQGVAAFYFPVNEHLEPQPAAWLQQLRPRDLVVAIDYFGFPCPPWFPEQVRQAGAWLVEDASQALLTADVGRQADFVIFSPRKFVGVPDGGVLRLNTRLSIRKLTTEPPPVDWWLKSLAATVLRREFDRHGGAREWLPLAQATEKDAPVGPYAMSELSRQLLSHGIDFQHVARRRRENYGSLLNDLNDRALFRVLPDGVVPFGFPIRVPNRDHVQESLLASAIQAEVHWPIRDLVPAQFEASHRLAADLLTLPCDQRCGGDEMDHVVQSLRKACGG